MQGIKIRIRIRWVYLLMASIMSLLMSSGMLSAQTGSSPVEQRFDPAQKNYYFLLDQENQVLNLGDIREDQYAQISLKIINNTGRTLNNPYRTYGGAILWYRDRHNSEPLPPGDTLVLKGHTVGRIGPYQFKILIMDTLNGKPLIHAISLKGNLMKAQTVSKPETAKKTETPVTSSKKSVNHTPKQNENPQIPPGKSRFGEGTVHQYNPDKNQYEFKIAPNRFYGSASPRGVNDIFVWDTLKQGHYGKILTFSFRNTTQSTMYLQDEVAYCPNFRITRKGQSIIKPDSLFTYLFEADTNQFGDAYGNISLDYRINDKIEHYQMGLWAYQPESKNKKGNAYYKKQGDSLYLYIINRENQTQGTYRMRITNSDSTFYLKAHWIHGEHRYQLPASGFNQFQYEVFDQQNKVVTKEIKTRNWNEYAFYILANDQHKVIHTYNEGGPVAYHYPKGQYIIQWNRQYSIEEVKTYLAGKGLDLLAFCEPGIRFQDEKKLIELQKSINRSVYQIVLQPLISYHPIDQNGWGGGCEYYTNQFRIAFVKGTSDEQIKSIFKVAGIKEYRKGRISETDKTIEYWFKLDNIIDGKCMKTLDHLWNRSEVILLVHEIGMVGGLD